MKHTVPLPLDAALETGRALTVERADSNVAPCICDQQPGINSDTVPSLRVLPPVEARDPRKRSTDTTRARVLVIDGHPMVEEWVGTQIGTEAEIVCGGHGADLAEAAVLIARGDANLVLLEIANDVVRGLEIMRSLKTKFPKLRMIVFSSCDEVSHFAPALRAGAQGFVSKAASGRELLRAIRRVLEDEVYLSKTVLGHLLAAFSESLAAPKTGPSAVLSERELQVFAFVGEGLRPTEIAHRISVSVKTVESYLTRIREKLHLRDARALFQNAVRWSKTRDGLAER